MVYGLGSLELKGLFFTCSLHMNTADVFRRSFYPQRAFGKISVRKCSLIQISCIYIGLTFHCGMKVGKVMIFKKKYIMSAESMCFSSC